MDLGHSTLRLGSAGGPWLVGILVLALAVIAVLGVREAMRIAVPLRRRTLIALRLATALCAALFVLDLQWVTERMERVDGRLAVLLDASRSMGVRDGEQTRAARAAAAVRALQGQGSPGFELFRFGDEARPVRVSELGAAGLALDDDTRIERALERVAKDLGDELGAVLVISDGADRAGPALAARAARLGVRVHSALVAGSRAVEDDAIVTVHADPVAFLRQDAQVEVSVRSTRTRDAALPLTLRLGDRIVAEGEVSLDAAGKGSVKLPFNAAELGRAVYTVSLPLIEGDAVPENNERSFLVRVTRDKLRVLLLCGAPSWDTRFLRAFLRADPSIDLITFFILRTNSDLTMAAAEELSLIPFPTDELFREHLSSFDLVIFQDFNYGPYQVGSYLPRITEYVRDGGAFAMVGGARAFGGGGYDRTPIAEILPVVAAPGPTAVSEEAFRPMVTPEMVRHPIVELVPEPAENVRAWSELAPLLGANRILGLNGDGVTLLQHPVERDQRGEPMPLLAVGHAGKGRVLAFATDSSWRMGLTTAGQQGDASAFERFWERALRWLVKDPALEPSTIETDRERYGPGARIQVRARLRDARYQPLVDQAVTLGVIEGSDVAQRGQAVRTDADGVVSAVLDAPLTPGAFEVGAWTSSPEGTTVIVAEPVVVEASGDELSDPQAVPEVLRALSASTSGRYFDDPDDVRLSALDRSRTRSLGTRSAAPFSSPWFFAFMVALLGLEWALRRAWSLR